MTLQEILSKNKNIVQYENSIGVYEHIISILKNDGLNLEFGVYQGYSINFISSRFPNKKFYGFDSFEGLPEDWGVINGHNFTKGAFNLDGILPKVNDNVVLIKGWFQDTLPKFLNNQNENIAFLNIDCDLYSSTVTILENCKNFIKKDTIIYFDEFHGYDGWENGEYKAWNEFIEKYDVDFEVIATAPNQLLLQIK